MTTPGEGVDRQRGLGPEAQSGPRARMPWATGGPEVAECGGACSVGRAVAGKARPQTTKCPDGAALTHPNVSAKETHGKTT